MPSLNIHDIGDQPLLGYSLTTASGAAADASVSVLSINPNGISSGLTPTHLSTGVYQSAIDLDVAGRWLVRWTATGAIHDTETVTLMVRSNAPVRADSAYANIDDVVRLAQGRTFGASSKPTVSDVQDYLNVTKTELDGLLRRGGYAVPVGSVATSTLTLLAHGNALGAACLVESSAPTSNRQQAACKLWADFRASVLDGSLELDAAKDSTQSAPRSNAVNQATPLFLLECYGVPTYDW